MNKNSFLFMSVVFLMIVAVPCQIFGMMEKPIIRPRANLKFFGLNEKEYLEPKTQSLLSEKFFIVIAESITQSIDQHYYICDGAGIKIFEKKYPFEDCLKQLLPKKFLFKKAEILQFDDMIVCVMRFTQYSKYDVTQDFIENLYWEGIYAFVLDKENKIPELIIDSYRFGNLVTLYDEITRFFCSKH